MQMSEVKKPAVVVDPVAIGNMTDLFYQVFEIFNHSPAMVRILTSKRGIRSFMSILIMSHIFGIFRELE